ncbi:MAG: transketolase [Sphaerochaetaceae bacterium]|nr:transketolase [Sphaerochaetaceae bacterium]
MYTENEIFQLQKIAVKMRRDLLEMVKPGKVGHLGGSASIMDIMAALYFKQMNFNPNDIKNPERDIMILSKGHAALAQYAALIELGIIDKSEMYKIKTLEGKLQGHPDMEKTPGIEAVTGSLGQGLSIAVGMALGLRLDKKDSTVYTICGDGELAEGQIWEAIMSAHMYELSNLVAIVDHNRLQASDTTEKVMKIDKLKSKFEAFGWEVIEIDGHNMSQVLEALENAKKFKGGPTMIIAETVKGKGFSFAENQVSFHNAHIDEKQYQQGIKDLDKQEETLNAAR